eukprot:CAMPEP_0178733068 /NCGR_PEP_ID=MMETSP0744-20121128/598_1 /TAXON_ID=913974 /ORGANISM="Nitzschia punctata, Strain CCMP561" /LENGTH=118 /DNA_ID=CAMNT_0020385227 /DNA_START=45 /DNA_END=401 /DNA_ORIENTATION=-
MRLTPLGKAALQAAGVKIVPVQENEEAHIRIKNELLTPIQRKLFDIISNGKPMSRAKLAKEAGYDHEEMSGFKKAVSTMKSLGVLEYIKNGGQDMVQLTDLAFPCGRGSSAGDRSATS